MSEGQGHLKTPAPYSDKSDIPFGLMEDVIPTAIAMTPTGLKAIPDAAKERIKELEAELSDLREDADELRVLTERLVHEPCEDAAHCSCVPLLRKKVKELESQMPKVVVPTEHDRKRGTAYCACEAMIVEWDKYCNECGAQLNWEGLK